MNFGVTTLTSIKNGSLSVLPCFLDVKSVEVDTA